MTVLGFITIIYLIFAVIFFILGIVKMVMFAEFGREDEDFRSGLMMFIFAIIWPYLIYKIIKTRLDEADGGEE